MAISKQAKLRIYQIAMGVLEARRREMDAEIEALINEISKLKGRPAKSERVMGRFVRKRRGVSRKTREAARRHML